MALFNFLRKKSSKESKSAILTEINELDLFENQLSSDQFLLKVGQLSDINKKFQKGFNLLHFAVEFGELKLAKVLLERGININDKNDFGNTPLWIATFNARGSYEMVDLLLSHGADPYLKNHAGRSPVAFAKIIEDKILIEKLIKNDFNQL
ncbi:ankyrin repeat domain-containing protein [Fulvivirga ligni]|uniref:ankyrin repeat domain-containing protein n=1 Tax=Fulvivirga ligni TaxID=2904246 RepID=UPI001F45D4DD|nr:ankyrin repeat domain-containing protein [Fulvivirga ligni]UII23574.1 ankyrin repeat domain-containing protein [Fulvivirga ligni]